MKAKKAVIIMICLAGTTWLYGCKKETNTVVDTEDISQNESIDNVEDVVIIDEVDEFVDRNSEALNIDGDSEYIEGNEDVAITTKDDLMAIISQMEAERDKSNASDIKNDDSKNESKDNGNSAGNKGGGTVIGGGSLKQDKGNTETGNEKKDTTPKSTPKPTPTPKPSSGKYASVNLDGADVLVTIKVTGTKKGSSAEKLLRGIEDENGASFGAIANKGYTTVVSNIKVTLPSYMDGYTLDCIPEIRVRDTKGNIINGEAVYVYVSELGDYDNSGLTKTYDIIYELPEGTNSYMIQFGEYGEDNYNYIVK